MDGKVQSAQIDLPQTTDRDVDMLGSEHGLEHLIGEAVTGLVVLGETLEYFIFPCPVLQHLAGSLDEITRTLGKARTVANTLRTETVHCGKRRRK